MQLDGRVCRLGEQSDYLYFITVYLSGVVPAGQAAPTPFRLHVSLLHNPSSTLCMWCFLVFL
jgi:hypothetical protein